MQIDFLLTHSGRFHADDLLAHAVLSALFPQAELIRTRDPQLISSHIGRAVIFDVGHDFDPSRFLFDHHQPDKPRREDGGAYSSFGLIWQHFGADYIRAFHASNAGSIAQVQERVDAGLVRGIDATDNFEVAGPGDPLIAALSLPGLLEGLNPLRRASDDELAQAFAQASLLARRLLDGQITEAFEASRHADIIRQALRDRVEPVWIELDEDIPADPTIHEDQDDKVLFVIARGRGEWILRTVGSAPGSVKPKRPLPADWAGRRGVDLQAITGIETAKFCHSARFLAVSETRDGAIALLRQALAA